MASSPSTQFTNGKHGDKMAAVAPSQAALAPRRVVLLMGGEDSDVKEVLVEYQGAAVATASVHADVQRFAAEHRGRCVAAEWLGTLGWTRFLWCRK